MLESRAMAPRKPTPWGADTPGGANDVTAAATFRALEEPTICDCGFFQVPLHSKLSTPM